jgi:uncharacterized membrane protein YfcA
VHLSVPAYLLLAATGLVSGLVDAIAGGGGLVALPILLNLGFPPALALGTSKLQASIGTSVALRHYVRRGVVDLSACRWGIVCAFGGGLLGAWTVTLIDSGFLARLIPWMLAAILLYTIFRPRVGLEDHPARVDRNTFLASAGLGLGFYDGFFGPGTGSFWTILLVVALGQSFLKATGHTKVMNLASNVAALLFFAAGGHVDYPAGLCMAVGQVIGGRLGAGLVVKNGARFVRPIFLAVVTATVARLLWVMAHK